MCSPVGKFYIVGSYRFAFACFCLRFVFALCVVATGLLLFWLFGLIMGFWFTVRIVAYFLC